LTATVQDLILSLPDRGDRAALLLRTSFRTFTWSYAELARQVRACAHWFASQDLVQGERVVFWAPNSPIWVSAYLACLASGLVPVPLDLHSAPHFVERIADETGARVLLRGRYQTALPVRGQSMPLDRLEWLTRPGEPERTAWPALRADDLAELMYTSGTTSSPKGVMLTHENLRANLEGIQPIVPPEPFYRFVSLLPLSHAFEQTIGLFLPLSRGGQITYLETLKPSALIDAFRKDRPNAVVAVPRLLDLLRSRVLGRLPKPLRAALSGLSPVLLVLPWPVRRALFAPLRAQLGGCLRYVVVGGAPLDRSVERFWDALGILVLQGYGLTETAPVLTANTPSAHRIGSVGKPLQNVSIRIDPDGGILARGPNVTPGYYQRPEATAAAFVDGWLRTGDLGQFDRDGFLYLRGRQKDMIVTPAGLRVYPEDVEAALNRQSGVRESAVLEWRGQVHAVLLLDPLKAPSALEIVAAANRQLNPIQQIRGWTLWPGSDFPRTPTLKVRKFKVREALASNLPSRAHPTRPTGRVAQIVQDLAPDHMVSPAGRLGPDLGLSSIDRLELITLLEEEFHVDIPDADVTSETTVAGLDEVVRRGERLPSSRPPTWQLNRGVVELRDIAQRELIFPILRHAVWLTVEGSENLRSLSPPVIFAGNHVSHLDGPTVLMALPPWLRRRTAVAALAGFYFPTSANPLENTWHWTLFDLAELFFNVFPVPRARGFRESLRHAGFLAEHGWSILIFPEGTRSVNGQMTPFREGIGLLATELKVPIVPFLLRGTHRILPPRAWVPRPGPASLRFGAPLYLPPMSYGDITREIEKAVIALAPTIEVRL